MPNPVTHWEITSPNGRTLAQFYANLFGWSVDLNNPMNYGMVHSDRGIDGGIGEAPGNRVTFYVEVDDPQAMLDKAVSAGGKVEMPVMEIPGAVTMAQFSDPEGNIIGLVKGNG